MEVKDDDIRMLLGFERRVLTYLGNTEKHRADLRELLERYVNDLGNGVELDQALDFELPLEDEPVYECKWCRWCDYMASRGPFDAAVIDGGICPNCDARLVRA